MVSQGWLHANWRPRFTASHLSWTTYPRLQRQAVVKVHGVFPSSCGYSASSPRISSFTDPSLRQRPSRYAIRAGRNLPDKEFRYLRTVIATAAVYRGLDSSFARRLTPPRDLPAPGRRRGPHTSSYDFAETCVFGKQSLGPLCGLLRLIPKRISPTEAPLLPKLRGHFAEFLNEGSSDRLGIPSVSVLVRHAPPP